MELLTRIQDNWIVLWIPVIAAVVGWLTNVVAVKMMFKPIEFVGIPPFLGWQGIVPANAVKIARASNKIITTQLLSLDQLFENFSPEMFAEKLGAVVDDITDQVIDEIANKHAKAMWDNAGQVMQTKIREQIRAEIIQVAIKIARDLGEDVADILDIEKTVLEAVDREKSLMGDLFLGVGGNEFKFIERSGLYFGFLFGLFQMIVWVMYPAAWILPAAGLLVGYITNFLAIKLIFRPVDPINVVGFRLQGLFHKRKLEVSAGIAAMISARILNAENIVKTSMNSPNVEKMHQIVERHIGALVDNHPMIPLVVPADKRPALRAELLGRIRSDWAEPGGFFYTFAEKAVDLKTELHTRLAALDNDSYEGILRPPFQEDEWKLIAAGAVLGFIAGVLQLVYLFGDTMGKLVQ